MNMSRASAFLAGASVERARLCLNGAGQLSAPIAMEKLALAGVSAIGD
jgi:hypothetical protein